MRLSQVTCLVRNLSCRSFILMTSFTRGSIPSDFIIFSWCLQMPQSHSKCCPCSRKTGSSLCFFGFLFVVVLRLREEPSEFSYGFEVAPLGDSFYWLPFLTLDSTDGPDRSSSCLNTTVAALSEMVFCRFLLDEALFWLATPWDSKFVLPLCWLFWPVAGPLSDAIFNKLVLLRGFWSTLMLTISRD